jgi:hypothetical protein
VEEGMERRLAEIRKIKVQSQPRKIVHETLSQKYPTQRRAGRVIQVIERLSSKCDVLNSNPSAAKSKTKLTSPQKVVITVISQD